MTLSTLSPLQTSKWRDSSVQNSSTRKPCIDSFLALLVPFAIVDITFWTVLAEVALELRTSYLEPCIYCSTLLVCLKRHSWEVLGAAWRVSRMPLGPCIMFRSAYRQFCLVSLILIRPLNWKAFKSWISMQQSSLIIQVLICRCQKKPQIGLQPPQSTLLIPRDNLRVPCRRGCSQSVCMGKSRGCRLA